MPKIRDIGTAFLFSGRDFVLGDRFQIKHPSLNDIWELGEGIYCEEVYWAYVMTLMADPYDNMVWLDDYGVDYEEVDNFKVFGLKWLEAKKLYQSRQADFDSAGVSPEDVFKAALRFFLGDHDFEIATDLNGQQIIYDAKDETYAFGADMFELLVMFLERINCISRAGRINPANKAAKQILIEDKRDEEARARRKKNADEMVNIIGDAIGAVAFGGCGAAELSNMGNLHIFPLLSGSRIKSGQMRVQAMLNGVYTGMMKSDGIKPADWNWADTAH